MPAKIRLARHGKKKSPHYYIVVADGRAPRDGKYIEKIGVYNPKTNPATIQLEFDKAYSWLMKGAVPTETCRSILRYEGVLMKKHLMEGVKKGAFDEATAETKLKEWQEQKVKKIEAKKERISRNVKDDLKERLEAETKVNEARSQAIAAKLAKEAARVKAAAEAQDAAETEETADVAEETIAEVPAVEETVAEETIAEIPAVEETVAEATVEQPEASTEGQETEPQA